MFATGTFEQPRYNSDHEAFGAAASDEAFGASAVSKSWTLPSRRCIYWRCSTLVEECWVTCSEGTRRHLPHTQQPSQLSIVSAVDSLVGWQAWALCAVRGSSRIAAHEGHCRRTRWVLQPALHHRQTTRDDTAHPIRVREQEPGQQGAAEALLLALQQLIAIG